MGTGTPEPEKGGTPMHISYQPLWNTLKERGMRKEDLRLAAGLTTNMIANMGKGKNISMETLVRICKALNCGLYHRIKKAFLKRFTVPSGWYISA